MAVDVRIFAPLSSIDTCAVWNVLSSRRLSTAAAARGRNFILVDYVRYECLTRPRANPSESDIQLQDLLRKKLERGDVTTLTVDVNDLREIARVDLVRRLGRGEIAAIALARKIRGAFLSDDRAAYRIACDAFPEQPSQTTPQLVGWLVYVGELTDGDFEIVVREHNDATGRSTLSAYFRKTYQMALHHRLAERQ